MERMKCVSCPRPHSYQRMKIGGTRSIACKNKYTEVNTTYFQVYLCTQRFVKMATYKARGNGGESG